MFGTKRSRKSFFSVFLAMVVFVTMTFTFSGEARVRGVKLIVMAAAPAFASRAMFQSTPTYDSLLQDDSSGDMLRFSSTTGAYQFSRCSTGYILTGTGTVTVHGCTVTLSDTPADRRVTASLDNCLHRGNASIQVFALGTTFTITDRNTRDDAGAADQSAPQLNITAPNGGEIVDVGTGFTISWNASDNVGITSQDLQLSTDGGSTFSPIVQGLAGDVTQYTWTAPLMNTSQTARVRLVAHDAACNIGIDDSDANFTILNPSTTFTHIADSPNYLLGGGFNSMIHLCNTSANTVIVEIGVRNRFGTGLVSPPANFTLTSGQVRAINLNSYLTPGTPSDPGDPNVLMGSIRLRHNGSQDSDVRPIIAVDRNNEDTSFVVPFTYVSSQQSPSSTMQCAPLYYFDDSTSAWLSLQNTTNAPVSVGIGLHYGTGAAGTPNGVYNLPAVTVPAQGGVRMDLSQFASVVQGTNWGTVVLNAPPQTIVGNTVMVSNANHLAFNSNFVDPAMCASATKVISTLKLDYAMGLKSCVMVSNTSSADTRSVTVNFQTDNGVAIPSQNFSLSPGQQKLIELDSQQLLAAGTSSNATAQISYSGNAGDIIGGAVSMSAPNSCAIPAQFTEPHATDGRRLVSPFFRFDERTSGIVQIANLGGTSIQAGLVMKFADTTLPTLNTDLISVPAGGTATLDLQSYFGLVDDGVAARGCVELIHNGVAGSVTATFTAIGKFNNLSLEVPLAGGPAFNSTDMALFPNNADVQYGDTKPVAVMTGGGLSAPNWSVSATNGDPGSIAPTSSTDPTVFKASFASPASSTALTVTVKADATSSGGGTQSGDFSLSKVKLVEFTSALNDGRLDPKANTDFTLRGKADFPDGSFVIKFKQGDQSVDAINVTRSPSNPKILTGTAPPNIVFIGDAQIVVIQDSTKISKDATGAAYYAFNPPTITTSSPDGFNRMGGFLTINGNGFETFQTVKPTVDIGGLGFDVNTVSQTKVDGDIMMAPCNIKSCQTEGQAPCKFIRVTNPGGRKADRRSSNVPLYNLKPGPAPTPRNRFPDSGFSIGGTAVTVTGTHLDCVNEVSVGGIFAPNFQFSSGALEIITPPHMAGSNNAITLFDVDDAAPGGTPVPNGNFTYVLTPPQVVPLPTVLIYIVGPQEGIEVLPGTVANSPSLNCINSLSVVPTLLTV